MYFCFSKINLYLTFRYKMDFNLKKKLFINRK